MEKIKCCHCKIKYATVFINDRFPSCYECDIKAREFVIGLRETINLANKGILIKPDLSIKIVHDKEARERGD